MPIWRLQTSWAINSAFPRDRMVITPHFDDAGALTDPDSLCEDLADALLLWWPTTGELQVSAYDAQGTPPVFPQGEAIRNQGEFASNNQPRELACCLSFYGTRNLPRQRGRLYIPALMIGTDTILRPTPAQQQKVGDLAPIFEGLGGVDVDWCVYSRTENAPHSVTNWFVDNEWDIIRSRGLRGDERLTGTTSEG